MDNRIPQAKVIVTQYYNEHHDEKIDTDDVAVVWFCKTIQNWKVLLITFTRDNTYYALTYNGDKSEWHLDVYNQIIK